MLDIKQDITSLSNFQRNTRDILRLLKESGRPVVLTVNGKAELVVQEAASYQKLFDQVKDAGKEHTEARPPRTAKVR